MMHTTFWTVLLIIYGSGSWDDYHSSVVLPPNTCQQVVEAISEPILRDNPKAEFYCYPTSAPYTSIAPKTRPENLK